MIEPDDIDDLVHEQRVGGQQAALAAVRPGVSLRELHGVALAVVSDGIRRLGLLDSGVAGGLTDAEAALRWMPHGIGHMLGVDVHDSTAVAGEWMTAPFRAGHVITIEPGLYLSPHDQYVPEHLRGIGVRIEDDVLVTAGGHDNLTAALPRSADEVERWLAPLRAAGTPR
nr:M24 family metallopeptidase [Amycolatopsis sp. La24]